MRLKTMAETFALAALLAVAGVPATTADAKPAPKVEAPPAKPGARPAAPAAGPEKVTSVEGITEYRLANGLRVLLFPDPAKPTITVNVTYLVGSRNEQYGETGMAHLLEHLVFKGTPKHPNIPQELTSHGARPNGSTWFDRTNYFETFQATDQNFDWALDLESDRMVHSYIAKKDLDSEMTVVRNEFESGENDPRNVLEERTISTAYIWHNYGHPVIGARADIESVPIERLQAFYRNYYQPDNAVLLVAGRFDEQKALAKIARRFGPIPKPTRTIPKTYTQEPTQDGERAVTLRRVGDVQSLCAVYHTSAGSHDDAAPVDVLAEVLGATPAGRLHKALVETKKATEVGGFQYQLREPGLLVFTAQARQDMSLDEARNVLLETVEGVPAAPATAEEVERAKTSLLKGIELTLNNSERVGLTLSEWIGMGDWRLFFLHRDRLKKVKPEDVTRVAAAYLKPSNRTVGVFVPTAKPERAEIPPVPDVAALLKDYKGEQAKAQAEAFDPSPANVDARTRRLSLPNGAKVALLPKKTRGGSVVVTLTIRFGDETALKDRGEVPGFVGSMLMRGTAHHTRQQIKDEFDRLKARVNVFGGTTQAGATVETVRENLADVLKLLAEVLKEPSFPPDELEQLRQEQLAGIEEQRSEPQAIAFQAFSRHMSPYPKGDVRYVSTFEEDIEETKAVKLDDLKAFYRDFYGASNAWIAVVGDCDADEVTRQLTELFGSWKSPRPFARIKSEFKDVPAVALSLEAPDKANAFFVAGQNLALRDDDPDYPALVLGNFMLGGGFLNSRLAVRLRQKEGLSYGVGSQMSAHPFDPSGSFTAFAIYAPENAAKLETAFREEIDRVLKDGFAADEVAQAKTGFLQSRQVSRAQDARLAGTLASYLYFGRTLAWDAALEDKVNALTPAQIHDALKRFLDPAKLTQVKAGDFAKAAAKAPAAKPQ